MLNFDLRIHLTMSLIKHYKHALYSNKWMNRGWRNSDWHVHDTTAICGDIWRRFIVKAPASVVLLPSLLFSHQKTPFPGKCWWWNMSICRLMTLMTIKLTFRVIERAWALQGPKAWAKVVLHPYPNCCLSTAKPRVLIHVSAFSCNFNCSITTRKRLQATEIAAERWTRCLRTKKSEIKTDE